MTVWRGETGELEGYSDKDKRAYNRLKKLLLNLAPGEMFEIECWFPRSGPFHRLHMKMESALYSSQEQFINFERFRDWLKINAGFVDFYPGPDGQLVAIPQSISFKRMDDEEMKHFHEIVKMSLFAEHALRFLYPNLSPGAAFDLMDNFLLRF